MCACKNSNSYRRKMQRLSRLTYTNATHHETPTFVFLGKLWRGLRYSARALAAHKGFTCIAVITLALGIGANTAIFTVTNALLLRPFPYRDPEQLVSVEASTLGR